MSRSKTVWMEPPTLFSMGSTAVSASHCVSAWKGANRSPQKLPLLGLRSVKLRGAHSAHLERHLELLAGQRLRVRARFARCALAVRPRHALVGHAVLHGAGRSNLHARMQAGLIAARCCTALGAWICMHACRLLLPRGAAPRWAQKSACTQAPIASC